MMQKGQVQIILIGILVITVLVSGAYYLGKNSSPDKNPPKQIGCTDDAKICPDGSSVGRTGPNCEFAACSKSSPSPAPTPTPDDLVSQECEVCGSKGLHNLEGRQCAPGLECKNQSEGVASSVYFCVKPGGSIKTCLGELE